jgi:hypothetical protein
LRLHGFAAKLMRQRFFGFAVRCEGVALPRRQAEAIELGYAPKLFAEELLIFKRGRSPKSSIKLKAGQSRRRTSDG